MSVRRVLTAFSGLSGQFSQVERTPPQVSETWNAFTRRGLALMGPAVACIVLGAVSTAAAVTLSATDAGFVTSMGGSAKGDGTISPATYNYSVGWEVHYVDGSLGMPPGSKPVTAMNRKNYFVFDLTSVTTPILSATFVVNAGTYESSDGMEILDLFAPGAMAPALADADFLLAKNAIGSSEFDEPSDMAVGVAMAHYGNVAGGPPIGTALISSADDDMFLMIAIAPSFLNSFLGSRVVFGGELSSLTATGTPEAIMGFTGPDIAGGVDPLIPKLELILVPEPGRGILLLLGAGSVVFGRRRP